MKYGFFFLNDTATTEIYTLSLHDALPICLPAGDRRDPPRLDLAVGLVVQLEPVGVVGRRDARPDELVGAEARSEEHTSELQSRQYLVCRLLLEKKKTILI